MIVEIELAVIIVLMCPWGQLRQIRHRWAENKKLAAEHAESEKLRLAIARENHNADV